MFWDVLAMMAMMMETISDGPVGFDHATGQQDDHRRWHGLHLLEDQGQHQCAEQGVSESYQDSDKNLNTIEWLEQAKETAGPAVMNIPPPIFYIVWISVVGLSIKVGTCRFF